MKNDNCCGRRIVIVLFVLIFGMLGCDRKGGDVNQWIKEEIEVSPGDFIEIARLDRSVDEETKFDNMKNVERSVWAIFKNAGEWTHIRIPWNGATIEWKGVEIPLSIREYEGRLYMIGFDRVTNREKPTYRYYEQKGRNFQEIAPGAYPKAIATQNMWFSYRYFDSSKGDRVDRVQLAREIDPDNVYFHSTATAEIWCQLMTGKEYYEFAKKPIDRNVLMEFKAKYKPIKLTKIIRE